MFLFLVTCSLLRLKSCCLPFWQCTFYFLPSTLRPNCFWPTFWATSRQLLAFYGRSVIGVRTASARSIPVFLCVCTLVACWTTLRQGSRIESSLLESSIREFYVRTADCTGESSHQNLVPLSAPDRSAAGDVRQTLYQPIVPNDCTSVPILKE